jgi:putative Holliday junction resolvase
MSQSSEPGRVLAIDYGTVRLGLAISDARQQFASPYANYTRISAERDLDYLQRVISDERVVLVVVGLPVHLDGRESEKSLEARRFAAWLNQRTGTQIDLFDERFTSVEAESYLSAARLSRKRRKARRDMLAAQVLLTAYLESDRTQPSDRLPGIEDPRS